MSSYFIYYTEANIVCVIIFGIMLFRDFLNIDRQEKQIEYDHALISFMLYFITDAFWASVIAGKLPRNSFTVLTCNFLNCVLMALIVYAWLRFVLSAEQMPTRNEKRIRFLTALPLLVSVAGMVIAYLINPQIFLDKDLNLQPIYTVFQITVPCIYIVVILIYALRRAAKEESRAERNMHLFIGFFPLLVILGGLLQVLVLPETPVFCFCCAILMLVFYINNMETQISTDQLTGLNNRRQLERYSVQKSNARREGRRTFAIMFDIDDFKKINDTYGHAAGDGALVNMADAFRSAMRKQNMPMFLARYGGDEFTMIIYPTDGTAQETLIREVREQAERICLARKTPYMLRIGAGYDELKDGDDTIAECIRRADEKLYLDKMQEKAKRKKS